MWLLMLIVGLLVGFFVCKFFFPKVKEVKVEVEKPVEVIKEVEKPLPPVITDIEGWDDKIKGIYAASEINEKAKDLYNNFKVQFTKLTDFYLNGDKAYVIIPPRKKK